jgi:hypothetical protein
MNHNIRSRPKFQPGPRIKLPGIKRLYRGLTEKEAAALQIAANGFDRYKTNQTWRELVELKSAFIPKIWSDIP